MLTHYIYTACQDAVTRVKSLLRLKRRRSQKRKDRRLRNVSLWLDDTLWDFESFPRLKERRNVPVVYTTGDVKLDKKSFELFNAPLVGQKPVKVSLRLVGGIGGIRVSMRFFNTKDNIEYLVEIQESS